MIINTFIHLLEAQIHVQQYTNSVVTFFALLLQGRVKLVYSNQAGFTRKIQT